MEGFAACVESVAIQDFKKLKNYVVHSHLHFHGNNLQTSAYHFLGLSVLHRSGHYFSDISGPETDGNSLSNLQFAKEYTEIV